MLSKRTSFKPKPKPKLIPLHNERTAKVTTAEKAARFAAEGKFESAILADLRARMGLSATQIAKLLECSTSTYRDIEDGLVTAPSVVLAWMHRRVAAFESDPPPRGWLRRTTASRKDAA